MVREKLLWEKEEAVVGEGGSCSEGKSLYEKRCCGKGEAVMREKTLL